MKSSGIDLIFRRNDQNFIYGITYVDHKSKCVFNGSDLGKEFSAAMIRDRWGQQGGEAGSIEEKLLGAKSQSNDSELSTGESKNTILEELTVSSSGFNNQLPYQFRKKRKRRNRKL